MFEGLKDKVEGIGQVAAGLLGCKNLSHVSPIFEIYTPCCGISLLDVSGLLNFHIRLLS